MKKKIPPPRRPFPKLEPRIVTEGSDVTMLVPLIMVVLILAVGAFVVKVILALKGTS